MNICSFIVLHYLCVYHYPCSGGVQARQWKTDKDFVLILIKSTVAHRINLKSFTEPNPSPGNLWLFICPRQQSEYSWRAIRDLCQWNVVQWGRYSCFWLVIKRKETVGEYPILRGGTRKSGTGRSTHIMSSRKTQCMESNREEKEDLNMLRHNQN